MSIIRRFRTFAAAFAVTVCVVAGDVEWRGGPTKDWHVNWDKALAEARKTGKAMFLLNTGSDWCGWCMRLRANVLDKPEFVEFAREKMVLVYLDSPHNPPLGKEQMVHNRQIVKALPFGGGVPHVLVMNAKGEKLGSIGGGALGLDAYLDKLRDILAVKGEMVEGGGARLLFTQGYAATLAAVANEPSVGGGTRQIVDGKTALERLREKKRLRAEDRLRRLEPSLSAKDALKKAQDGDPRGFYQLAIMYSERAAADDNVKDSDFKMSDKCLSRAVEMGYGNALLLHAIDVAHQRLFKLKHCGRHRHSNDWYLCAGMEKCYFEDTDLDGHTMLAEAFTNQVAVAEVVAAFDLAARAGVKNAPAFAYYITNDLARIAATRLQKRMCEADKAVDIDTAVDKLFPRSGSPVTDGARHAVTSTNQPRRTKSTADYRRAAKAKNRPSRPVPLFPFAEAVRKAKEGDGAGLFSVALHYAKGLEIAHDGVRAEKYMRKAVDAGFGSAVFANALLEEAALSDSMLGVRLLKLNYGGAGDNAYGSFRLYTGASASDFKLRDYGYWNVTNEVAIAEIRAGYVRASELGVTQATNALERFEGWLAERREEIMEERERERQWREKIDVNAKLAKEFLGEDPSTNAVFRRSMRQKRPQPGLRLGDD